ncbi:hypothetical protein HPB49_024163 [Dermacentor silvarum]|uniref:Uncharacterized protein n=1 Tax=Dermacentor silvarum TaxID=543639 RepID=A0ACB8CNC1_DERSI|nr:hypothetical protein HPB49_024163 [Dermacentor silvarum]
MRRCRHHQREHQSPRLEPGRLDVPEQQKQASSKEPPVAADTVPAGLAVKATADAAQRAKSAQQDAGKDAAKRPPPAAVPAVISAGPILVQHAPPKDQGAEVNKAPDGQIVGPSSMRVPGASPLKPTLAKDSKPSPTTAKKTGPENVVTAKEPASSRPQFVGGAIAVKGGITPSKNVVDMPATSTAQTVGRALPTLANAASTKFGAVPVTQQKPPALHEPNVKPPTDAPQLKVPHVSPAGVFSKAAATADIRPRVDQQVNKVPFRAVDKLEAPARLPEKQLVLPMIPKAQRLPPGQEAPGAPLRGPLIVQGEDEGLKKGGPMRQQAPVSPKTIGAAKPTNIGGQDVLHTLAKAGPRGPQVLLRPTAPKKVEVEPFKKVLNGQPITKDARALNHDQGVADAKLPKPVAPTGKPGKPEKKSAVTKQKENVKLPDIELPKPALEKVEQVAADNKKRSPEINKKPSIMPAKSKPKVTHKLSSNKGHAEKAKIHTRASKKRDRDYSSDLSASSEIAVKHQDTRIEEDEAKIKKGYPSLGDQKLADVKHHDEARRRAREPAVAGGVVKDKKRKRSVHSEAKIDYSATAEAGKPEEDVRGEKTMPRKGKALFKKALAQVEPSEEVRQQQHPAGRKAAEAVVARAVQAVRKTEPQPPAKTKPATGKARESARHQKGDTIHREKLVDQASTRAPVKQGVTRNTKPAAFPKAHQPRRRSTDSEVPTVTDVSENSTVRFADSPYIPDSCAQSCRGKSQQGNQPQKGHVDGRHHRGWYDCRSDFQGSQCGWQHCSHHHEIHDCGDLSSTYDASIFGEEAYCVGMSNELRHTAMAWKYRVQVGLEGNLRPVLTQVRQKQLNSAAGNPGVIAPRSRALAISRHDDHV